MGTLFFPGERMPGTITMPAEISTAGGLVAGRFETATAYAASLWGDAQNLLTQLGDLSFPIDWEGVDLGEVDSGGLEGISAEEPAQPSITPIETEGVDFPYAAPVPVESTLPVRTAPTANITEPNFNIPEPPDVTWPVFNEDRPSISDIEIPNAPTITLPAVPQLAEISIPSPPEYSIPEFDWELPTDDLTAPEPQFVYNEAEYSSALTTALADKLYTNLISGGSGLPDATEQAIYDKAVSRQLDEEQDKLDQILNFFADRLFELPPGALSHQMLEMNNKILKTREDLNNDILTQQSKLAQDNTHAIIQESIQLEKNLMDNTNQFQARALDAAKFVVQGALAVYATKVEAYKARLLAYTSQAEVYKARISGEIAKAEFYKAQVEGLKATASVQESLAKVYIYQVEGLKIHIDLYKAQMEGASLRAEVDKTRIMGFAAMVQAYSAQVTASSERYRGYQAQISGEIAKAELYKSQAVAYTAMVDAYKTEVEADTLVLQQQIEMNKNEIDIFKAQLQKYSTDVEASVSDAKIQAMSEGLKIDVYKALSSNYEVELNSLTRVYLGRIEEAKASADIEIKEADLTIREALGKYELVLKAISAAAQIASQMAAAAISGVSASANIQNSESRSDSRSGSISESYVAQDIAQTSISVSHIYTHSD